MSEDLAAPDGAARWADACLGAALLAVDPVGLGGLCLAARAGPVRDSFLDYLRAALGDVALRRMPAHAEADRLTGALDLGQTLSLGRPVWEPGLLADADGDVLLLPMAERVLPGTAALIASALDTGSVTGPGGGDPRPARFALVALDEHDADEPGVPRILTERMALLPGLDGVARADTLLAGPDPEAIAAARDLLPGVTLDEADREQLCAASLMLGTGMRTAFQATAVARAAAALDGRTEVAEADVALALRLVLVPRATRLPPMEAPEDTPPEEDQPDKNESETDQADGDDSQQRAPEEIVLDAARAVLPAGLLAAMLQGAAAPPPSGAGAGTERKRAARGRRVGVRRGPLRAGDRLDIVATLRTAAPWQRLRGVVPGAGRIAVRGEDFRVLKLRDRGETLTIFAVDASGSAAIARLAEAKGAVELMLAEAYSRRDHVALLAFRKETAELLLPPTRALARAKRALAALPGGGATPLAAGLAAGLEMAVQARRRGQDPLLVVLTDGKANVPLDPAAGRAQAAEDATRMARRIAGERVSAMLIDTARRPQATAANLAGAMHARYLAMPQADAVTLGAAIRAGRG